MRTTDTSAAAHFAGRLALPRPWTLTSRFIAVGKWRAAVRDACNTVLSQRLEKALHEVKRSEGDADHRHNTNVVDTQTAVHEYCVTKKHCDSQVPFALKDTEETSKTKNFRSV